MQHNKTGLGGRTGGGRGTLDMITATKQWFPWCSEVMRHLPLVTKKTAWWINHQLWKISRGTTAELRMGWGPLCHSVNTQGWRAWRVLRNVSILTWREGPIWDVPRLPNTGWRRSPLRVTGPRDTVVLICSSTPHHCSQPAPLCPLSTLSAMDLSQSEPIERRREEPRGGMEGAGAGGGAGVSQAGPSPRHHWGCCRSGAPSPQVWRPASQGRGSWRSGKHHPGNTVERRDHHTGKPSVSSPRDTGQEKGIPNFIVWPQRPEENDCVHL